MKILVDRLPDSCAKCLFFVPGSQVTKNMRANEHCRLTLQNMTRADANKKRHDKCPITTAG